MIKLVPTSFIADVNTPVCNACAALRETSSAYSLLRKIVHATPGRPSRYSDQFHARAQWSQSEFISSEKGMNFDKVHFNRDSRWIGKVYIHSPEDLILYKLIYFGLSQQSKHARDTVAILKSKQNELDLTYIEKWVARLGLSSVWKEMLDNVS